MFPLCLKILEYCHWMTRESQQPKYDSLERYVQKVFKSTPQGQVEDSFPSPCLRLTVRLLTAELVTVYSPINAYCTVKLNRKTLWSSVRKRTMCPAWNEAFHFLLHDPEKTAVVVTVWKVRSRKSITAHLWDDNLGTVTVPFRDVCRNKDVQWYNLQDGIGETLKSRVELSFDLETEVPIKRVKSSRSLEEHLTLSYLFLSHHVVCKCCYVLRWKTWESCLCDEARTILNIHACVRQLKVLERCYCYLRAVTCVQRKERINISVALGLLERIQIHFSHNNERRLAVSLKDLLNVVSHQLLQKMAYLCETFHKRKNEAAVGNIRAILSCCTIIESITKDDVVSLAHVKIRSNAEQWLRSLTTKELRSPTEESFVGGIIKVLSTVLAFNKKVNKPFEEIWNVSYTEITISEIDRMIREDLKPLLLQLCHSHTSQTTGCEESSVLEKSLVTYHLLNQFISSMLSFAPNRPEMLCMDFYHSWFSAEMVCEWLEFMYRSELTTIGHAINQDGMEPRYESHDIMIPTSSAEMLLNDLETMVRLWADCNRGNDLLTTTFAKVVSGCALEFVKQIEDKLWTENMFYMEEESMNDHKVCAALFDVLSVKRFLNEVLEGIEGHTNASGVTSYGLYEPIRLACRVLNKVSVRFRIRMEEMMREEVRRASTARKQRRYEGAVEDALIRQMLRMYAS